MSGMKPKSALDEVLQHWKSSCLEDPDEVPSNTSTAKTREDLQTDARTFFRYISQNTQVVTDSNVVLQTKSSHEEALAQLVQDLGPAFTHEHHSGRVRALYVLTGAIDGCKETQLSTKVIQLLGTFLLGFCGPIDDDEYGEDYDSMIRDAAIQALTSLLSTSSSSLSEDDFVLAITSRIEFARVGVDRRCATPDMNETPDPYGFRETPQDIRGGLSTLPRSKRGMCFELLNSAVVGVSSVSKQIQSFPTDQVLLKVQTEMVAHARFTANCMHGESDPRCLQQMLKLIHAMQVAFKPWFGTCTVSDAVFPTEDIFDAVAPYFPIQFTPPPNDVHGISREGLNSALLSVLTFTQMDQSASQFNRQSMMTLSADLLLEQLLPAEENPGPLDKLEAVQYLSALLFPTDRSRAYEHMETRTAQALSEALKATHDEASLGVSQGGQMGSENKTLADACRTFVSKVAVQLEQSSNKALWEAFVDQTLQRLSPKIRTSPSHNKTAIAYIACLTASGGPRTLRSCLSMGMEPLLEYLQEKIGDDEKTAAAINGIGAFLSSCRVAIDRARTQGVVLNPHPLDSYCEKVSTILLAVFHDEEDKLSPSIKVGAVRALECLLFVATTDQATDITLDGLVSFLEKLLRVVTVPSGLGVEFTNVSASSLGKIVGGAMDKNPELENSLLGNKKLKDCIMENVYPSLLSNESRFDSTMERSDLQVLSIAGSSSSDVADPVMNACLELLLKSLEEKGIEASTVPAESVAYLLRKGGDKVVRAYHKSPTVDLILASFDEYSKSRTKEELRNSVSNLALPDTIEEKDRFKKDVGCANKIAASLLPAYRRLVPPHRLIQLLKAVSDILPPLSEADSFKLCIWLPILSTALQSPPNEENGTGSMETDESADDLAQSILQGLADLATGSDFVVETRSAAASCLYSVIVLSKSSKECPVVPIVQTTINPTLSASVGKTMAQNSLSILALLGSAAAGRGGPSSSSADKIASFLVEAACEGKAPLPFSDGTQQFDATTFDSRGVLELTAASAYGSMLSISSMKPLIKQRLTYASLKNVKAAYGAERDQARNGQAVVPPKVGLLAVVCYIVCNCDVAKLDRATLHQVSTLVVEGLSSTIFQHTKKGDMASTTPAKNLVVAATLKVICSVPSVVNGFTLSIVTGLLRAYAVADPVSEVSCKLLALQGLEAVAHMEGARSSTSTIKPAVVAVLAAAMNHPSGLLRQAAVDVRNAWYVLD